jgi:hypothetical protein
MSAWWGSRDAPKREFNVRASTRLALLSGLVIGCLPFLHPAMAATAPPLYDNGSYWADPRYGTPQVDSIEIFATGAVSFGGAVLTGPNAASYSIVSNTCANTTVPTNGSCLIGVQLHATAVGPIPETLEVTTNFGPYDIDLTANVQLAQLVVSPATLDFGFQAAGTVSAPKTLTVTNPNPVPDTIDFYFSTPAGPFDVTYGNGPCGPVPAHGSCTLSIDFRPLAAGVETGRWFFGTGLQDGGSSYQYELLSWTGTGVIDSATNLDLSRSQNVSAFGAPSAPTSNGGLDGLGNAYSRDFFANVLDYGGQQFAIGDYVSANAVSNVTLPVPAGPYFAVSLLATAVRGNQPNQGFVFTYTDGTSEVLYRSLSDWHLPQKYAGESIALSMPYRLTANGSQQAGSYNLYTYTLPINHMKTLASIKLPSRSVVVLAANLELNGVPTTVDLDGVFNVDAFSSLSAPVPGSGIDRLGGAIATNVFYGQNSPLESIFDFNYSPPPNAVTNAVVALPPRTFSKLDLLAMGVRGNQANQTLIVTYTDGTTTVLHQSFSDWHTPQNYPGESIGLAMPYRLNQDGSEHPGMYNAYQYHFALDATKTVASLKLPANINVVTLAVSLEP